MVRRRVLVALVVLVSAAPAWAVKNWYDHYYNARDRLMPAGKWDEALADLQQAVRLKPQSALQEQTYGLDFLDYLPYYQMGLCYLRKGDYDDAERMFEREEKAGAIRKSPLYNELSKRRAEAQNGQRQRLVRQVREAALRLQREAEEAARKGRLDEALVKLAEAGTLASQLNNPEMQQAILDRAARLRAEQQRLEDDAARARRLEQALAEGRRLLEADDPATALLRFDEALTLEPHNAAAGEGKREAQARILASRNRQALEAALREGRALFDAQRYEEALRPLGVAAADPSMTAARELLAKAQQVLENMRQQKDLRGRIETLMAEGDRLYAAQRYPEAQVRFENVLQLDPAHVAAQERLRRAEEMSALALMSRWLPNYPPSFTLLEPSAPESDVEGPRLTLVGVAHDDRGLARITFEQDGRAVAEIDPPPGESGNPRTWRFDRAFELRPGANEVTVVALDVLGLERRETYRVTRRLRFYETGAFAPSVLAGAGGLLAAGLMVQRLRRRRAVQRRFNPYIAGAPVMDEALFFGRRKLLQRILNVLHHNSLIITGERRIGKTTFLYHLKRALDADDVTGYRFFPVFIDLQGVPEESFFHALMADVVDALSLAPETLGALRYASEPREAYHARDFSHDAHLVIGDLKTRTDKHVKLALLIDEVDVLNEYSEQTNQRLRSIFMKTFSEHLVAVMSGVGIKRVWTSEGSPWYNFFDEIELRPFDREDAEALIRTPVEGIFRYEPDAVEAILAGSEMKPYVIQKFCIHAVNRMIENGRTWVSLEDVEAVRETARFDDGPARAEPAQHTVPA
jgi:hypothetical protein